MPLDPVQELQCAKRRSTAAIIRSRTVTQDAAIGDGRPGDDFPIGVDDEQRRHDLAVAGGDFEMIRAPALTGAQTDDRWSCVRRGHRAV